MMRSLQLRSRARFTVLVAVSLLLSATMAADSDNGAPQASDSRVLWLDVRAPIGPAIGDFIERALQRAGEQRAQAVVVHLDTPGGLDTSMRSIIKAILAAPVPVVVYVGPSGARAASAGTYILYASHVAAMAPATNIGAATPIPMGPGMLPSAKDNKEEPGEGSDADDGADAGAASPEQALQRKVLNDAVAYIRGLAQLRGRNQEWAEAAVRSGASISASEALELGVIDLLAVDVAELLRKLHGRTVSIDREPRTTILFPVPIDLMGAFKDLLNSSKK